MNRWSGRLLIWPVWALAGSYSDDPQSDINCQLSGQDNCIIISLLLFLPLCINPQYIVSYQDNHIIINWLLPYLFITMNRWDHLDHFSQNLTFLFQSTLSKKSTFCFCRSRIPWTAPIHNSFVLWRCMWKELAPLDQPSTKCRKMIFQEKVKF